MPITKRPKLKIAHQEMAQSTHKMAQSTKQPKLKTTQA